MDKRNNDGNRILMNPSIGDLVCRGEIPNPKAEQKAYRHAERQIDKEIERRIKNGVKLALRNPDYFQLNQELPLNPEMSVEKIKEIVIHNAVREEILTRFKAKNAEKQSGARSL